MAKPKDKVIIDTNLWISLLLTGRPSQLITLIDTDRIEILFSAELLEELITVAGRPKFRTLISADLLADLLLLIERKALFAQVNSSVDLCRDPKDNFLLSLAKDGMASVLLTGDSDLLSLGKYGHTRIITWKEFEASLD